MIKLGNAIINEKDISAIYPSSNMDEGIDVALKSGCIVWTDASMEQAAVALLTSCWNAMPPQIMSEIALLESLSSKGYRFLARDKKGALWAYCSKPSKGYGCWDAIDGKVCSVQLELYNGLIEWHDDIPTNIKTLHNSMMTNPEMFNEKVLDRKQFLP